MNIHNNLHNFFYVFYYWIRIYFSSLFFFHWKIMFEEIEFISNMIDSICTNWEVYIFVFLPFCKIEWRLLVLYCSYIIDSWSSNWILVCGGVWRSRRPISYFIPYQIWMSGILTMFWDKIQRSKRYTSFNKFLFVKCASEIQSSQSSQSRKKNWG